MPYDDDEDDDYNSISAIKTGVATQIERGDKLPADDTVWIGVNCSDIGTYNINRPKGELLSHHVQLKDEGIYIIFEYKWRGHLRNRNKEYTSQVHSFVPWHLIANVSLYHISNRPIFKKRRSYQRKRGKINVTKLNEQE